MDKRPLKVFLCHASADKPKVRELYRTLKRRGVQPWLDAEDLIPGQNWEVEIPNALLSSDAIIICLTPNSVDKEGYVQKEIKFALDKAMEMPEGRIFIIPARLEECELPFSLRQYQAVNLYEKAGYTKLMKALKLRASQLERATVELPKAGETTAEIKKVVEEKKPPEPKEEKPETKTPKPAQEKIGVGGDVKDSVIVSGSGNVINIGEQKKPEPEKPLPKKTKPPRKPNTAIMVALIGLAGTIIAALLGSPIIEKWFFPVPNTTEFATVTATLTNRPATPSQTVEPNRTPTESFTPTVSPATIPSAINLDKIAFVSNRDGNEEIYVMNSNGGEQTRLTQNPGRDFFPQWSPDGSKIAFLSERENKNGLFIMDLDGTDGGILTPTSSSSLGDISNFSWSPDGKKIVFVAFDGNYSDLSIISLDTLSQYKLTDTVNINEFDPSWSPDGSKIAFFREQGLFVIDPDGGNEIEISKNTSWRNSLNWSPDGSKIVFWGSGSLLYDEIFVVDLESLKILQLTENNNEDKYPVWSPDGFQIAFVSSRQGGTDEIFIMSADGSNVAKLSNFFDRQVFLNNIEWSNNGKKIIFQFNKWASQFVSDSDIVEIDLKDNRLVYLSSGWQYDDYSFVKQP